MKKYLLLVSCSFLFVTQSYAKDSINHLQKLKEMYVERFNTIDENQDGLIDKNEYLSFQFEDLRTNILVSNGFDDLDLTEDKISKDATNKEEKTKSENEENKEDNKEKIKTLDDFTATLEEMANFDIDFDEELSLDKDEFLEKPRLTKEDFLPISDENEKKEKPSTKDDLIEDKELDELIKTTQNQLDSVGLGSVLAPETKTTQEETPKEDTTKETPKEDIAKKQEEAFLQMLDENRKSLPKKIDEITTWTDINYKDNLVTYIYQADVDTSVFSAEDLALLRESIKTDACHPIYKQQCPKLLPLITEQGKEIKIQYMDNKNIEISYCELNKTTCQ